MRVPCLAVPVLSFVVFCFELMFLVVFLIVVDMTPQHFHPTQQRAGGEGRQQCREGRCKGRQREQPQQFGVEERRGGGKGKAGEEGCKKCAGQRRYREQSWRRECVEDEEEEEGARGVWTVGGAEEVRDGRRRNEWTGGGEDAMQNELTSSATLGHDVIQTLEREVVDAVRLMMSTMTDPIKLKQTEMTEAIISMQSQLIDAVK